MLKNEVKDKTFFLFGSFSFYGPKQKPAEAGSESRLLAGDAHKPESPNRNIAHLAIRQLCTLNHPANVILVIDPEITKPSLTHGGQAVAQPRIDRSCRNTFFGGKFLRRIIAHVGLRNLGLLAVYDNTVEHSGHRPPSILSSRSESSSAPPSSSFEISLSALVIAAMVSFCTWSLLRPSLAASSAIWMCSRSHIRKDFIQVRRALQ